MTMRSHSYRYAYFICGIAALGGFIFSFDNSAFNASQLLYRNAFQLNGFLFGVTTAAAVFGCMLAPMPGALLNEAWGSKRMMQLAAALLLVGAVAGALSPQVGWLISARIVSGLGAGIASLACPMYIAEVAPPSRRGVLGLLIQIAIMIGSVCGILLAWGCASLLPATTAWRWVLAAGTVVYLLFALLVFLLPASPRWLMRRQRESEAHAVLSRIDNPQEIESVMQGIRDSLTQAPASFRSLLRPEFRPAIATGLFLAIFNSWTGWSMVGTYLPTLFERVGYRVNDAVGMTTIPAIIGLIFTLLAALVIDRLGRRPLWIAGSALMAVLLVLLGLLFVRGSYGFPVLLVVLLMMLVHTTSVGPIPWMMIPEVVPGASRAAAMSICTTGLWGAFFLGSVAFPSGMAAAERWTGSPALVFWALAGVCVLSLFFGLFLLPETRGRTLEQISVRSGRVVETSEA